MKPNIVSLTIDSLIRKGFIATLKVIFARLRDMNFDIRHGTETDHWEEIDDLAVVGTNSSHAQRYQPTNARALMTVLNEGKFDTDTAFLDIGCGKGRALVIAAEYGFKRLIGVEFSKALCEVAVQNIERSIKRIGRSIPLSVVNADAASFKVDSDVGVIFLFNPFDEVVLGSVLKNIEESLQSTPRNFWIIYNNPVHRLLIENNRKFVKVSEHEFPNSNFCVYKAVS